MCFKCGGSGWLKCPECFGNGHMCVHCFGRGEIKCPICNPAQIELPKKPQLFIRCLNCGYEIEVTDSYLKSVKINIGELLDQRRRLRCKRCLQRRANFFQG